MDYGSHYNALITRAVGRSLSVPTESHHIVPRCMGGSDAKSNRVDLTPEEHFVAHQLLTKMHPEHRGLAIAAAAMATDNRNGKRSSNKLYGWLRRRALEASFLPRGPCPPERAAKISAARLASPAVKAAAEARKGTVLSDETRQKLSDKAKTSEKAAAARAALHARQVGRPRSEETKAKSGNGFRGKTHTPEARAKMSAAVKAKPKSPEHLAKIAAALRGRPSWAAGKKFTPEHRAKIAAAARARAEARRQSTGA